MIGSIAVNMAESAEVLGQAMIHHIAAK